MSTLSEIFKRQGSQRYVQLFLSPRTLARELLASPEKVTQELILGITYPLKYKQKKLSPESKIEKRSLAPDISALGKLLDELDNLLTVTEYKTKPPQEEIKFLNAIETLEQMQEVLIKLQSPDFPASPTATLIAASFT